MKTEKLIKFITLIFVLSLFAVFVYGATVGGGRGGTSTKGGQEVQDQKEIQTMNQGEDSQIQTQTQQEQQEQTQTQFSQENQSIEEKVQNQERERAREEKMLNIQKHASSVANFVQNLLEISEREKGVGGEIRTIAREQNESSQKSLMAMKKIQERNKIATFLFGSDYKNLGELRSEMVKTRNRLEQLKRLTQRLENEGDKTELQNQIQTLEQEQAKIENFIKEQEGKFSLFGWLLKLFKK